MSTFKCAICEQDVDMFDHGRLECGTAMRRERDSALVSVEAEQVRTLFWKTNAEFHQGKYDSALAELEEMYSIRQKLIDDLDSALAKLKVAEEALGFYADRVNHVRPDLRDRTNYLNNMQVDEGKRATAALAAIRADAGPAKAETTCPMHGKTDCCCG